MNKIDTFRLSKINELGLMYSKPVAELDLLTSMATKIFKVPTALVTIVGSDEQWFKSKCGIDVDGTPVSVAFCNYTIAGSSIFEVTDPQGDQRFSNNDLVTGELGLRYYAGMPINIDNVNVGSFCLLGYEKRSALDEIERKILTELSELTAIYIQTNAMLKEVLAGISS